MPTYPSSISDGVNSPGTTIALTETVLGQNRGAIFTVDNMLAGYEAFNTSVGGTITAAGVYSSTGTNSVVVNTMAASTALIAKMYAMPGNGFTGNIDDSSSPYYTSANVSTSDLTVPSESATDLLANLQLLSQASLAALSNKHQVSLAQALVLLNAELVRSTAAGSLLSAVIGATAGGGLYTATSGSLGITGVSTWVGTDLAKTRFAIKNYGYEIREVAALGAKLTYLVSQLTQDLARINQYGVPPTSASSVYPTDADPTYTPDTGV